MSRRRSDGGGLAALVGVILLVGLVILIIKWALITAAILAVPFGIWWVLDHGKQQRTAARRAEVESRAVVDAAGGCGWCGSRLAHVDDDGRVATPSAFHRVEIDEAVALG